MKKFDPKTLKTIIINRKPFLVSHIIYEPLKRANAAMIAATGKHIQINNAYRSTETQAALYKKLKEANKNAIVAPPGFSFHEKGQAIDVQNWQEAQRFLIKEGFSNPLKNDKVHFSIGEFNIIKETVPRAAALLITSGIIFILYRFITKGRF